MNDEKKTKDELISELELLRQTISELKDVYVKQGEAPSPAIPAQESSYSAIFDAANDAIIVHDIEFGRIIDVNRKACEMFLYRKDEMLNLDMWAMIAEEDPNRLKGIKDLVKRAQGGEAQLFELLAKDKVGRHFWVEINLKRAVINGRYRLLAIKRDITERRQNEERFARINEMFLNFAPDSIENIRRLTALCGELLRADCALYNRLEGNMLYSCGQWNVPEGYNTVDEGRGHICYDVIEKDSDDVIVISNLQNTSYADSDPNVKLYSLSTYIGRAVRFGSKHIGALCAVYKFDFTPTEVDKKIIGIIASAIGVEEERRSVEEMSELAQFSIEKASDSIFWIGPDARILYVNDATCRVLGYSREELLEMTIHDIDSDYHKEVWPAHWKDLKERRFFTFETEHRRKDGTTFSVEVTVNYLEFQGDEYNYAFARDITERKKQEEVLLNRDEQLEILSRTSQHINAILEVPVIMRTLVAAAMELVGGHGGMAGLLRDGKIHFTEYNKDGVSSPIDYSFDLDRGAFGCTAVTKKPYISNDARSDPDIIPEFIKDFNPYNLINVPIINHSGDFLGCFEIHDKEGGALFSAQDVFMLQGLAANASVALENARMFGEQKETAKALAESEKRYRLLADNIPLHIGAVSKSGKFIVWNKFSEKLFGYSAEEVIEKLSPSDIHQTKKEAREVVRVATKEGIFDRELNLVRKDGKLIPVRLVVVSYKDAGGAVAGLYGFAVDISIRRKAEAELAKLMEELIDSNKKLRQMALKDPQTGLYNHRYLMESIETEFARAKKYGYPLTAVMIDVDYFKSINDTYGHDFGDIVLKQLAVYLKGMIHGYDILVRFGGEEFVIISPGLDRRKGFVMGERIRDAIALYNFGNKEHSVKLNLSIGVSSYPEDRIARSMDLIDIAGKILDKTKDAGGDRVYTSLDTGGKKKKSAEKEPTDVVFLKDKIGKLTKQGKQNLIESIAAFAKTIEMKDHYTGEHVEKTVHYATEIARNLDLSDEDIENVKQASMLHDLGKVGISDRILLKKSKLTKKEYEEIKKHPQIAADIIRTIQFMHDIVPLVLYHHERWDGKGYPGGLKGEEIPIGARIIAISDVYQALTSNRPYRKAHSERDAVGIIKNGAGTQFDPKIANTFLRILKKQRKSSLE